MVQSTKTNPKWIDILWCKTPKAIQHGSILFGAKIIKIITINIHKIVYGAKHHTIVSVAKHHKIINYAKKIINHVLYIYNVIYIYI